MLRVFHIWLLHIRNDETMRELQQIRTVQIWSDGGRKHFKNRLTMTGIPHLFAQSGIQMSWSFFAPYHGSNPCDSHAGIESQQNARLERQDRPNLTANMFGVSSSTLINTFPVVLDSIPRFEFDASPLSGISGYYHFEFPGE